MLDLLITGARALTMDAAHPVAHTIGVWRGRIVGVDDSVAGLPSAAVVDLGGAWVVPGFVDAHVHLAWAGLAAGAPSVASCGDRASMLAAVGLAVTAREVGEWVDVVGYDQRGIGGHITAAELDTVAAGRKVHLIHDSGHACVVSSEVLALLPAGVVHRSGLLVEGGAEAVRTLRQPYSRAELVDAIERAGWECLSEGVTACAEAGVGGGLIRHSPIEGGAYQEALRSGRLPVRVRLMVAADVLRTVGAHDLDNTVRAMDLGLRDGFGGDRLGLGALKVFTDGGMMARTAALTSPYTDGSGVGELYADPAELRAVIRDAHRAGWQLAVHAIGDRAVDVALDGFADACGEGGVGARHRIEHAGLVRPDQLGRFASLGVAAVVQPAFLWSFGDDYARIMGPGRADWLYRGRSFLEAGVRLVGSSDRPVTVGAPLVAMRFMVDRMTCGGQVVGAAEAVTPWQAMRAYTVDAAWACGWEDDLGSIAPGRFADLVVLSGDPLKSFEVDVVSTVLAGDVVHGETW